MSRNTFCRFVIVLTLAAVLGTPLVSQAGPRRTVPGRAESRLEELAPLAWLWSLVEKGWEKAGCRLDPNGQCMPEPMVAPRAGCSIDPYGWCLPEPVTLKAGCRLDPDGRCLPIR
jgi:hypothetical protein